MGALHEGHATLIRTARAENSWVTVSIFVNPLQFGAGEDLSRYPRPIERDLAMAEASGADAVFYPLAEEMYSAEPTRVYVPGVSARWEGEFRPGHFDGVATVVLKLLNLFEPARAYFGRKDLQQCAVVRKMTEDLFLPVELRIVPTVRDADGLALSSRNIYLSKPERTVAPSLFATISEAATRIGAGEPAELTCDWAQVQLRRLDFFPEYCAAVRDRDLVAIEGYEPESSVIVAARLGNTRLIDNVAIIK